MMNPLFGVLFLALISSAPPPTPVPAPEAGADARLERKVTLRLKRTPLSEAVAQLGQQAGVPLRVAQEAADEPVLLWVTDQPVHEVMRQLALLHHSRWIRAGAREKPYYELRPRAEAKQEEQALHRRDREQAVAALAKNIETKLPANAAAERPALASHYAEMQAMQQLARQIQPSQWQALLAGEPLVLSTVPDKDAKPLPRQVGRSLQRALVERHPLQEDLPADLRARLEQQRQEELSPENDIQVRLRLDLAGGNQATLEAYTRIMHPGGRQGMVSSGLSLTGTFRDAPTEGPDAATLTAWAADPLLGKKGSLTIDRKSLLPTRRLKWQSQPAHLYELLPVLAGTYGVNLVADAYVAQRMPYPQPPDRLTDLPLHEFLTRYALPVSTWRKEGEFIQLRSRTWHRDRLAEVPDRVTKEWAHRLRGRQHLLLDDLLLLVQTLRNEQLEQLEPLLQDEGIYLENNIGSWVSRARRVLGRYGNREIVLALSQLTPQQRDLLKKGGKVALGRMSGPARGWLASAVERQHHDRLSDDEAGPGKVLPGELALSLEMTQVFMTLQAGERPRWEVRYTDGPQAGKASGYGSTSGLVPPAFPKHGQRSQRLAITYRSQNAAPGLFSLELPAVWLDPAVHPEQAPAGSPGRAPAERREQ